MVFVYSGGEKGVAPFGTGWQLFLKNGDGRRELFIVRGYGTRRAGAEARKGSPRRGVPRELMFWNGRPPLDA